MRTDLRLTPEIIQAIESVIARDERVMLIPTKDRIKVVRVRHDEVKPTMACKKTEYLAKY